MIYYAKAGTPLPRAKEKGLGWDCWYRVLGSTVEVWVEYDLYSPVTRKWTPSFQFGSPGALYTSGLPIVDKEGDTFDMGMRLDEGL